MRALPASLQAEAEEHLTQLARRHKIELHWSTVHHEAVIFTRQAWVPPVTSALDYLIGLHEMGHIVSPLARRYWRRSEWSETLEDNMLCEAAAWAWALEKAKTAMTKRLTTGHWRNIAAMWSSYAFSHLGPAKRNSSIDPFPLDDYGQMWPVDAQGRPVH